MENSIETAQLLFKNNKYQETTDTCNRILAVNPNSVEALKLISKSFLATQKIEDARLYLKKILNIKPNDYESIKDLGNTYQAVGDTRLAKDYYLKAIAINNYYAPALTNLGLIELETGNKQEALSLLKKATEYDPQLIPAWGNLANFYFKSGMVKEAEIACHRLLTINPNMFNFNFLLSNILITQNKLKEAETALRKTIQLKPDFFHAHLNLGAILKDLGQLQEAEIFTRRAIELKPNLAIAHNNMGSLLKDIGKLNEAEISTRKAIALKPDYANSHYNLGLILRGLGKLNEAEISTRKAIEIQPDYAVAHLNLGLILRDRDKLIEAEISTRRALEIQPNYAVAHSNLGLILKDRDKLIEAEISTRKAIEIQPNYAVAHSNLGGILRYLGKSKEAEISTRKAIAIQPDLAIAYSNLGSILKDNQKYDEAVKVYKRSIKLDSNSSSNKFGLITSQRYICEWNNQENLKIQLDENGIKGSSINPWDLFSLEDNPSNHLTRSRKFYKDFFIKKEHKILPLSNKKIHIGYFSADFREHPTMFLISSILKLHNKSNFKIFLYSFTPEEDEYTDKAKKSGCIFRDIKELNDLEASIIARNDQLDIAIDLMGYTRHNRMSIFSYRVAPIQINYLGFPGSVGADTIDYLLADKIVIPKENESFYSEKIIRMPNCYQCNDNQKDISKATFSREDCNLPEKGFIFTCFNNNYKITPIEFNIWMRLLKKVNESVLWLYGSNKWSKINLRKEALKRNIDPKRLIFAKRLPLRQHLARHALGDLAIDTFNCNGHTTTSDALWAGLPVLTKAGKSFAARVSASLLTSIGLRELITYNEKEYEEKAIEIATNPVEIKRLKTKLAKLKETSSLYNSELFTRDLESKFKELVRNQQ